MSNAINNNNPNLEYRRIPIDKHIYIHVSYI